MYVEKTSRAPVADNRPTLPAESALDAVYATRPDLLLDVQAGFILGAAATDEAYGFRALNLADETMLVCAGAHRPNLLSGAKGLRFAFDTGLVHEGGRLLDMGGDYTVAWVGRIGLAAVGGMVIGEGSDASQSWVGWDYDFKTIAAYHDGTRVAVVAPALNDATWHTLMVSYDATADAVALYVDGIELAVAAGVTTGWGSQGRIMVGGLGATTPVAFTDGDIGGVAVYAGKALSKPANAATRTTVNAWMNAVLARVSA